MLQEQWLITLRNWMQKRRKMNLPFDPALITLDLIQAEAMKMIMNWKNLSVRRVSLTLSCQTNSKPRRGGLYGRMPL